MEPGAWGREFRIVDCGYKILGARSQNTEFRRKAIKIEFLSTTFM
jgi:hypothetical protein